MTPDRSVTFRNPCGEIIPASGERRSRGNVRQLRRRHRLDGLEIDATTPVPRWYAGDRMDYPLAVELLCQIDTRLR